MNRPTTVMVALLLFTGAAAAQVPNQVQLRPGIVPASSPLYGVDKLMDTAGRAVGLVSAGDVAYERASEYAVARRKNNTKAARRANQSLNEIAEAATSADTRGLAKAIAVLQAVQKRTPDAANKGLSTALQNLRQAKQRQPKHPGPKQRPERPDAAPAAGVNA